MAVAFGVGGAVAAAGTAQTGLVRPEARPAERGGAMAAPEPQGAFRAPELASEIRPPLRGATLPRTRWQHMPGNAIWTRAALSALKSHGVPLVDLVPADVTDWCPAYPEQDKAGRRAFWVGFMSALAKYESTYKPWAVGGGGRWYGLLQILPATARGYKCTAQTGEALKNGAANLSCAVRILAHTVPRDGVIHGYSGRKGLGVTADWGPMHSPAKRRDMARWLRAQNYCTRVDTIRPRLRPAVRQQATQSDP